MGAQSNVVNIARVAGKQAEAYSPEPSSKIASGMRMGFRDGLLKILPMLVRFEFYSSHKGKCDHWRGEPCTCGMDTLRAEYNELLKG